MATNDRAQDLIDEIAEALHNAWCSAVTEEGYTLGPRDEPNKKHPHLTSWSEKAEREKNQDRYQAVRVMAMFRNRPSSSVKEIADKIHEAAFEYVSACRWKRAPVVLEQSWTMDPRAAKERTRQADAILLLLQACRSEDGWEL